MKVIIINSPLFRETNKLYDEDSLPPIGLGLIATNLKKNDIEVELIDAIYEKISLENLIAKLNRLKPNVIGTNIFTTNKDLVKELVESINYEAHFIIGGLSTKELYKEIFEWKSPNQIDIVTGDGELITVDIVRNQLDELPYHEAENRRVFFVDQKSKYYLSDISNISLDRKFFRNEPILHPLGFFEANIITSRGCIYNCTFCAAASSLNRNYGIRERSNSSIITELEVIRKKFPQVTSIRVLDDLFLKTSGSVRKAIEVFSNSNFHWRSMAHVLTFKNVEETEMDLLQRSGCYELFIGIESGSPKILKAINKTKNTDTILNNLAKVFKAGINMKGYFIYGFPGESEKDMNMTFELAKELKYLSRSYGVNFRTSVFQYRPYHGTQIYHDLEVNGISPHVNPIEPNEELSKLVGRLQFNFHSGNYSEVEIEIVHKYIYRTINLNHDKIFGELQTKLKPAI